MVLALVLELPGGRGGGFADARSPLIIGGLALTEYGGVEEALGGAVLDVMMIFELWL